MDLDTVGYIVWGSACLVAFVALLRLMSTRPHGHGSFLSRSFLWYLMAQTIGSTLWLLRDTISSNTWLEWAFWQVLLLAGCAYVAIGVVVAVAVFPTKRQQEGDNNEDDELRLQRRKVQKGLGVGLGAALVASILLILLQLTDNTNGLAIVVFAFYFPAASLALVGVVSVWWFEWPPFSALQQGRTRLFRCGCISSVMIRRVAVIAASIGMVDYLLPALEYIGLPLWECTFLTRLLDSVVYLPGIIPWIFWMDGQVRMLPALALASAASNGYDDIEE